MNNENTLKVKKLLEQAAGEPTRVLGCNAGWEAGGIERLFFNGADGNIAGSVEIRHGEDNIEHVRVELDVPAPMAAKVIALVSGIVASEMPALSEVEQAALLAAAEVAPERTDFAAAEAFAHLMEEHETEQATDPEKAKRAELARLILEQRKDKDLELETAKEQIEDEQVVEELDFDSAGSL